MPQSIEQARREVHSAFRSALELAEGDRATTFHAFERQAWASLLALGRAFVALFLARQAVAVASSSYVYQGCEYRLQGERRSELGTRFGKVEFRRPVGRPRAGRGESDLPVDRRLRLSTGFSLDVVLDITRLCALMAYATSRATFGHFLGWSPSPRAVMRMIDAVGDEARCVLEQSAAPDDDGEILVIQVDGKGAPMISETEHRRRQRPHAKHAGGTRRHGRRLRRKASARPRRTKGQKSKNAKVAVVGVIYTLKRTPQGIEGPVNKRIYATFESHQALFVWLERESIKRGYGRKKTLFLADGSQHIWRLQERYFPEAEACVDWYHAVEYLWMAGECLHREGSSELQEWINRQVKRLRNGSNRAILRELEKLLADTPSTGPGNKGRRERLRRAVNYYHAHQHRMPYADLRRRDLDIGTGAVEGAVRNLVGIRLDGPGMRWSRQRSERLLYLRCVLLNGQWHELERHLAKRSHFKLAAQPEPTQPHDARKVA
jgi:hypothetical protein